jgi:hypothetical protein
MLGTRLAIRTPSPAGAWTTPAASRKQVAASLRSDSGSVIGPSPAAAAPNASAAGTEAFVDFVQRVSYTDFVHRKWRKKYLFVTPITDRAGLVLHTAPRMDISSEFSLPSKAPTRAGASLPFFLFSLPLIVARQTASALPAVARNPSNPIRARTTAPACLGVRPGAIRRPPVRTGRPAGRSDFASEAAPPSRRTIRALVAKNLEGS